jgi:hypothetical protein
MINRMACSDRCETDQPTPDETDAATGTTSGPPWDPPQLLHALFELEMNLSTRAVEPKLYKHSGLTDLLRSTALELSGRDGRVLALSRRAFECLTLRQRRLIERSAQLLPLNVPIIEMAGGSVRCMLAGVHLARRKATGAMATHF